MKNIIMTGLGSYPVSLSRLDDEYDTRKNKIHSLSISL